MKTGFGEAWVVAAVTIALAMGIVRIAWPGLEAPQPFPPAPTAEPVRDNRMITAPAVTPTALPTAVPAATRTPAPSPTPFPTARPTRTPSPTPTATPTETPSPTPTATATVPPPHPLPQPGRSWPTPDVSHASTHYWLRRPLDPPFRCIASAFYPYGTNGEGEYLVHHGADFQAAMGTPIHASADGTIVVAGSDGERAYGLFRNFYGNLVVEELNRKYRGKPVYVLFGHLSEVDAKVGQRVAAGDVVGRVGEAGIAMGPHLHVEVRVGENSYGATRNPEFWLRFLPGRGTLVGRFLTPDGRSWAGATLYVRRADTPRKVYQTLYTYVDDPQINPDDEWGENFLWADAPAGRYLLETPWGRQVPFSIEPEKTSFLEVREAPRE